MEPEKKAIEYRVLTQPEELGAVENLQSLIWGDTAVPLHMLLAIANNGGLAIGAYLDEKMIGFTFGILGTFEHQGETKLKHHSHELGVHPDYRDEGIGFKLKRAQWQMVRNQGIELITWTFNPLESRNAYLNINKLGGVCQQYERDVYGEMTDDLNRGIPSDRFMVELWVNSDRVGRRFAKERRRKLDLANYLAANALVLNRTKLNDAGFPEPLQDEMDKLDDPEKRSSVVLFEIPPDFQAIRESDSKLALRWRMYTRVIFELLFAHGYWVTDFVFLAGSSPRSYYVLSQGNATLGVFLHED